MKFHAGIIFPSVALFSALQVSTAATLTWNRNLTDDDTAYYSMYDDSNWIVVGEHSGTAPSGYTEGIYRGDDVIIPNGITARWEDPDTGSGKTRYGRTLTVGTAEPGITKVFIKNNYTSGSLGLIFDQGMIGDPDNDLSAKEWHLDGAGKRSLIVKTNNGSSILRNMGCGSYYEFYGKVLEGICGSGGTSQIRTTGTPTIYAPDVWYGTLQFRAIKGTFNVTNSFVCGGFEWRDGTSCRAILSSDDHTIDGITFNGFQGSTTAGIEMAGGSITMKTWAQNAFTGPENFKLDTTTINLFGKANDTGIKMAARGSDNGPYAFENNFALGTLVVGDEAGDVVTMVSPSGPYTEGSVSTDAALYVGILDLASGAGFVIPEGIKVYTRKVVGPRTNVTGVERLIIQPTGTFLMVR